MILAPQAKFSAPAGRPNSFPFILCFQNVQNRRETAQNQEKGGILNLGTILNLRLRTPNNVPIYSIFWPTCEWENSKFENSRNVEFLSQNSLCNSLGAKVTPRKSKKRVNNCSVLHHSLHNTKGRAAGQSYIGMVESYMGMMKSQNYRNMIIKYQKCQN